MRQVEFDPSVHGDIDPPFFIIHPPPPPHHPHARTHCFFEVVPLGIAFSVSMVPLTAFSRSLVLSFAALTLPFSLATLSAFSEHTNKDNG